MAEDGVRFPAVMYTFHEDGMKANVTTDRGTFALSVVRNDLFYRTVAYHYGQDYVVDTVFDDGYVIEQFTRTFLQPTSYTFRKKCVALR